MFVRMNENTVKRINVVPENWAGGAHVSKPDRPFAEKLFQTATDFTMERSNDSADTVLKNMKKNDEWTNSTWRYALAKAIAESLRNNSAVISLSIVGSVVSDSARLTSDINLLLHTAEDKEEFETWIVALDKELTDLFRQRFELSEGFLSLLNCHVFTNEEVTKRVGYAALLTTPHANVITL